MTNQGLWSAFQGGRLLAECVFVSDIIQSSHHNIFPHKTFSKGWVAQKPILIGSLTAALRFSKGWVRKYLNLVMGIGCNVPRLPEPDPEEDVDDTAEEQRVANLDGP